MFSASQSQHVNISGENDATENSCWRPSILPSLSSATALKDFVSSHTPRRDQFVPSCDRVVVITDIKDQFCALERHLGDGNCKHKKAILCIESAIPSSSSFGLIISWARPLATSNRAAATTPNRLFSLQDTLIIRQGLSKKGSDFCSSRLYLFGGRSM